jgi:hypothetical protein
LGKKAGKSKKKSGELEKMKKFISDVTSLGSKGTVKIARPQDTAATAWTARANKASTIIERHPACDARW